MACGRKHIKESDDIPDDEWKCPKCGNTEDFITESLDACEEIHPDDPCTCYACGYGASYSAVLRKWRKKKGLIVCPCCKGSGVVSADWKPNK